MHSPLIPLQPMSAHVAQMPVAEIASFMIMMAPVEQRNLWYPFGYSQMNTPVSACAAHPVLMDMGVSASDNLSRGAVVPGHPKQRRQHCQHTISKNQEQWHEPNSEVLQPKFQQLVNKPESGGNQRADALPSIEDKCQELLNKLESGGKQRADTLLSIKDWTLHLAFDATGCRVVQSALEFANASAAVEIANKLRAHIRRAACSPHANYVVQKMVEVLPLSHVAFVVEELRDVVKDMACNRYACRIICRLLEHGSFMQQTASLVHDLVKSADMLSKHTFGHHVMEVLLEQGTPEQRSTLAAVLCENVASAVQNRNASHVVIAALRSCDETDCQMLLSSLLNTGRLHEFALHKFGSAIVQELLQLPMDQVKLVAGHLRPWILSMQQSKYGLSVVREMESVCPEDCMPQMVC